MPASTPSAKTVAAFKRTVWSYYAKHERRMPWRDDTSLYSVVVSEIMLQQTQVSRVMKKFGPFLKRFPNWQTLARAPINKVLKEWSGLGYNRRALYLKRIAERFTAAFGDDTGNATRLSWLKWIQTKKLPGIGPNTLGAIEAYSFNEPVPFIETNIRSAFIHSFFTARKRTVRDDEIMPLLVRVLADRTIRANAREWYWALMDYGAHVKLDAPNPSRRSAHHVRQQPFKGSNRQLRSEILKRIMRRPQRRALLVQRLRLSDGFKQWKAGNIEKNLTDLDREGFLVEKNGVYHIA